MSFPLDVLRPLTSRLAVRGIFDGAETLTATKALTLRSGQFQKLDPGGSNRDVTLPTVTANDRGYWMVIGNAADAAENLVLKDASGSTIATVNQSEAGVVYVDDDGAWQVWGVLTYAAS